jgi:ornithine cyclodeaminase/alanine dehydrogenase-like protein (mu-crystallin family)
VTELRLIDHDQVLAAISPARAIECVREGFEHHARGEWKMPSKVYLDVAPHGDFRAMPAHGAGLAIVKWITSFPGNPAKGLPTVTGIIIVSDATTGEPQALIDARAVTALRTGAVAPIATEAIAGDVGSGVGIIGCGLHGAWVARCMAAAGYSDGSCFDPDESTAAALADELDWSVGTREQAAAATVVCTITPGTEPVIFKSDLQPGQHINALGADGMGKSELEYAALASCALYCDEWEQASHGGEITPAVEAGAVSRNDVTQLGSLLDGAEHKSDPHATTLFDSTGLAIQDLAICVELVELLDDGGIDAPTASL